MPSDSRKPASSEALLLDQALDAVNQRISSRQPSSFAQISHQPGPPRSGFARAVTRARDRGVDFRAEYQRLSIEAMAAIGEPDIPVEAPKAAPASVADPPPAPVQAPQQAVAAPAPPAPAPAPPPVDNGLETTRMFLQFLENRDRQLLDLMRTMVVKEQSAEREVQSQSQDQITGQLDRLGKAVSELTQVIGANQPRFPRSVS
jgi:hypothetical protein